MDLSDDGGSRFEAYVEGLASVIGLKDRGAVAGLLPGLMMPCEHKTLPTPRLRRPNADFSRY